MLQPGKLKVSYTNNKRFLIQTHHAHQTREGDSAVITLLSTQSQSGSTDPQEACDDPEIVKLTIEYFYRFDYLRVDHMQVHLVEHAKVFAIAVKYQISGLQNLAAMRFEEAVNQHWEHEDFARAVHVVYTSVAEDVTRLRLMVVDKIESRFESGIITKELEKELCNTPCLAYDLVKYRFGLRMCDRGHAASEFRLMCCGKCDDELWVCEECCDEHGDEFCPCC